MIKKVSTTSHEDWLSLRSKYIGGSDAAAVVGMNPFSSPYSLWAEKTGKTPPFEGNLATEVGTYLEEFIAKKFEEVTGKKVRRCNQSIFNDDYPWAIANIDREIVGEDAGLEIKSTSALNLKRFKNGEFPEQYYVQCVHYLAITGKKRWYLAVLIGNNDFRTFTIERDEAEIAALMSAEEAFWQKVTTNSPPEADGSKATTDAITAIYREANDGSRTDLFGLDDKLMQYVSVTARIKELTELKEEMANAIKAYMGESTRGESDRFRATWSPVTRSTFDAKAFAKDHADMDLSKYYKTISSRTFKVAEINKER